MAIYDHFSHLPWEERKKIFKELNQMDKDKKEKAERDKNKWSWEIEDDLNKETSK